MQRRWWDYWPSMMMVADELWHLDASLLHSYHHHCFRIGRIYHHHLVATKHKCWYHNWCLLQTPASNIVPLIEEEDDIVVVNFLLLFSLVKIIFECIFALLSLSSSRSIMGTGAHRLTTTGADTLVVFGFGSIHDICFMSHLNHSHCHEGVWLYMPIALVEKFDHLEQ